MNECNNYNNLFVNESFVDDKERIVAEAKLQALQEAVTGAIIAAIILLPVLHLDHILLQQVWFS